MTQAILAPTTGTSFGHGAVEARVAARFADEDARTNARLDRLVKVGGRCRYCGATVIDSMLARHPEVCGDKHCLRRARDEGFVSKLLTMQVEREAEEPPPRPSIDEIAAAVTLRMAEAVESRGRPGREVAGPQDELTLAVPAWAARGPEDRPAVAAHQSPGAPTTPPNDEDEIMPENKETEKKLCTKCGTQRLRGDNKSGICSDCRAPWKKNGAAAKNGAAHAVSRPSAKNGTTHGCDPTALSDDDLALCIAEARARVRSRERLAEILAGEG